MAVPARKVSKTSQRTRRAHMALNAKTTTKCPNCGEIIKAHRVCAKCGYYKGKQVVGQEQEEVKETKKEIKKEKKVKKEEK